MFTQFPLSTLLLTAALLGLAVGASTGVLASLVLKLRLRFRALLIDGLLGATSFPLAFVAVLLIPWQNTTTNRTDDAIVNSTVKHYQHPHMVAYVVAMLLPILHELLRVKGESKNPKQDRSSKN